MYEFRKDDNVIGHSKLEKGDAPMGVAFGEFFPSSGFDAVSKLPNSEEAGIRFWRNLSVFDNNGLQIECQSGVLLTEFDLKDEGLVYEVSCVGIGYPKYEALFPEHVRDYEKQFSD